MVVAHDHRVVIAGETFRLLREQIVRAPVRKASAAHVNHYGTFVRAMDLRSPEI